MINVADLSPDVSALLAKAHDQCDKGLWPQARLSLEDLYRCGHRPGFIAQQLGDVCGNEGDNDDSIAWHRKAIAHDPTRYRSYENLIFMLDARSDTTLASATAARQAWWHQFGAPAYAKRQPHTNAPIPHRRLRVGYVGGDFNFHSAAIAWTAVVSQHSPAIETVIYSTLQPERYDRRTARWQEQFGDHFVDVSKLSAHELAQYLQLDQVDILVDLSGYTQNNRLLTFAYAPAPIRIQAWGYVTGTASPTMTHLFADPIVCPASMRADMAEAVVDLPALLTYLAPSMATGYPVDIPPPLPLPCFTGPPTFSVFQRAIKVTDECLSIWRIILEQLPAASIMFKGGDYTPTHRQRIAEGLGACQARITFDVTTGHYAHQLWYQQVDLSLDPWPQTGGVSTLEALWNGVPCVTLLGDRMIQRTSASFLTTLGLGDLVAHTKQEYIQKAIQFVTRDRARLADWRQRLRMMLETSPIIHGYKEAVELAYRQLWHEWCETQRSAA